MHVVNSVAFMVFLSLFTLVSLIEIIRPCLHGVNFMRREESAGGPGQGATQISLPEVQW